METKFYKTFRDNYEARGLETAIDELKKAGINQMDCVKILVHELKMSLKVADETILNSLAWKEDSDAIIKFRNIFDDLE